MIQASDHSGRAVIAPPVKAFPQRVFINPLDAAERDIVDGEKVLIHNKIGQISLPCRVTNRIMPGVIDIPEGAWWNPDEKGIDHGGNINVLTSHKWTPYAFGSTQHTIKVQVSKIILNSNKYGKKR